MMTQYEQFIGTPGRHVAIVDATGAQFKIQRAMLMMEKEDKFKIIEIAKQVEYKNIKKVMLRITYEVFE